MTIAPLRGGCPGAQGYGVEVADPDSYHGGAAGGAFQLSARGRVILDPGAAITANGGGGHGLISNFGTCFPGPGEPPTCDPESGGGSGGGILLEAAAIDLPATAALAANGGAGACSQLGLASDGEISESAAAGMHCSGNPSIGSGGAGGAGPIAGFNGFDGGLAGGGGGGGTGRIRINLPAGVSFDPGPPIVSPPPSLGFVVRR